MLDIVSMKYHFLLGHRKTLYFDDRFELNGRQPDKIKSSYQWKRVQWQSNIFFYQCCTFYVVEFQLCIDN